MDKYHRLHRSNIEQLLVASNCRKRQLMETFCPPCSVYNNLRIPIIVKL